MPQNEKLSHVIPGVGIQELTLYPPASEFYRHLQSCKEIRRLHKLRHLGALPEAFQGARHARFDYTLVLLHYIQQLDVPGLNSVFRLGGVDFSSGKAALQTLALAWNIGHLPGTFAVEKGVYRYLITRNESDPLSLFNWPYDHNDKIDNLKIAARALVARDDYQSLSRIFAILKLLGFAHSDQDSLYTLVTDFIGPFFLHIDGQYSVQWPKLRRAFKLVRHLAYLTLDGPYAGLQWAPNIPALLAHALSEDGASLFTVDNAISEVLSPIEKAVYDSIYHHPDARREFAVITAHICSHLQGSADASGTLMQWLRAGLFRELKVGRRPKSSSLIRIATIRLRSHFLSLPETPAIVEKKLVELGFSDPILFQYNSWNADTLLEPDEVVLDFSSRSTIETSDIGRVILWVVREFEDLHAKVDEIFEMLRKTHLEPTYVALISRAIRLQYPKLELRLVPWKLQDYDLFPDLELQESRGGVWASGANLSSPPVMHLLRDRSQRIAPDMRERYAELMGLRELRLWLRQKSKGKDLRCRWLIMTGSVQLWDSVRAVIEFDGAIVQVSARSGRVQIFALESKAGRKDPAKSLRRRVSALGLNGQIHSLTRDCAVFELAL